MKLAVSMYSYYRTVKAGDMDIVSFIHEAKKIGADGVELLDFFYKDVESERAAAQQALTETGLPVPIFSVAQNFAKKTEEERDFMLGKIKFGVDEALKYGAGIVRVFAGDVSEGITFEQAREWIIDGLSKASVYAHDNGIKLALENHGSLAGRGEQVRGIIEDVRARSGKDALGANPDTGNFLVVNQPSHEAIREVAQYAYMVHFKDFAEDPTGEFATVDGRNLVGKAIGEGVVDLHQCLQILREAGFNGWLSMEYEGREDPMTAVPRSLANARKYL